MTKECDCGATGDGTWAGIHSKNCAFIKERSDERMIGFQEGLDAAADYIERIGEYGFEAIAADIRLIQITELFATKPPT